MTTWPALCDAFLKSDDFGKYIKDAEKEGKKILLTLGLTGKTKEERIKIITGYVKTRYQWNGICRRYASCKVSDFMKKKSGSSADINLFLVGLLRADQIDALPVLLSTRDNGIISKGHPFEKFFNYEIVRVEDEGKYVFLDATERLLVYNELPERCINVKGLIVAPKSDEWIDILQDDPALTEKKFEIHCDEDLTSQDNTVTFTAYAYDAYSYREKYNGEESNLKEVLQQRRITPLGEITIQNALELDKPFVFTFRTKMPLDNNSGKLFIAPFLNQSLTDNIFNQSERTLPIDLIHRHAAKYRSLIHIPEGYEVDFLPSLVNRKGRIKISYDVRENNGVVEVNAGYEFDKAVYKAEEYQILKVTFSEMIKKFNEMIVLKKK